ncbi:MAG TPA: 5'-nucleotidase, lipoprotein e(P4) family [Blastocatellia bacterium]|jgi:5'-nucleotidase (lipoprotein e(P4) family)
MNKTHTTIRKLGCGGLLLVILTTAISSKTATSLAPEQADNEYQVGAVLWQQVSAESRALQYQAYKLARLTLDRDLRLHRKSNLKRAVVVDVDETVLDNSRYQAELIVNRQSFTSASWIEWCNRAKASAIPGAVDFLKYAATRGVRVFYVTNRRETEKAGTITNLKQLGFPDVSDETVVVRTDVSSKEPRRQSIRRRYRIVLLFGDNLSDFSNAFEDKPPKERTAVVEAAREKFGTEFIVLPNPMYGDWESAIYGYDSRLNEQQKAAKRKAALKTISSP